MPKAPEWLNTDIQEYYPTCQGNIRAIQRAIREKRGVEIAYMTITDRMKRLGLERPREKSKKARTEETLTEDTVLTHEEAPLVGARVSALADIVPVNDISEHLSPNEVQTLEHYERIIAQGIKTFVEVGHALLTIREQKLYRVSYTTFEDYLRERWDLSRPRAYQLIDAAQVVDAVSTSVDIVPVNEAQARPLASLPPMEQVAVWREVVDTAPPSGITAKHVQATVKRTKSQPTMPKAPAPRRPARMEVQEGLVWGVREMSDQDAWGVLAWLWDALNDLAPTYTSLRGMLARVERRFPEERQTLMRRARERKDDATRLHETPAID